MPRYDYFCPKCRFFEAERGLEDRFIACPQCGSNAEREPVSGIPGSVTETVPVKCSKERDLGAVHREKVQQARK